MASVAIAIAAGTVGAPLGCQRRYPLLRCEGWVDPLLVQVAQEVYEHKPIDRFDFFRKLVRAIAAGHVDRIETPSAVTGALLAIETRIGLGDGWAWIGERRIGGARPSRRLDTPTERRVATFQPYAR